MRAFIKLLIFILLLPIFAAPTRAQSAQATTGNGSITGRVTLGDKPAPNITVLLQPAVVMDEKNMNATLASMLGSRSLTKVMTDAEGTYHFEHLAAGRYSVKAYAPAYIAPPEPDAEFQSGRAILDSPFQSGRVIKVEEGQAVENQNFALTRGGVITGRVTDAKGRPAVWQMITLTRTAEDKAAEDKAAKPYDYLAKTPFGGTMYVTDDRGVYRIFGLEAGHYLVSTGGAGIGAIPMTGTNHYMQQTYYPGVTDKAKATIVEVKEGGEASNIDIRLGLPSQTYKASGRVVDAATGKPFSNAVIGYSGAADSSVTSFPNATSNARGEFQIDSIIPGKYSAFTLFDQGSEYYSEKTPFEITTADADGLLIKVHHGQVVRGMVVVDGGADAEMQASLAQLHLQAMSFNDNTAPRSMSFPIAPDGSFQLAGVQPGSLSFSINSFFEPTKFAVLRVERGGAPQASQPQFGVSIVAGETVNDIRVVLAVASGTIHGELRSTGDGSLDDYSFEIRASRVGNDQPFSEETGEVDSRGRFTITNLIPGEYIVTAYAQGTELASATAHVTITRDGEANISLSIELPARKSKDQ